ncbi:MAG: hypothetical protein AB1705_18395 [Verrucomicrobiota bacterium]
MHLRKLNPPGNQAFTLAEVVISAAISALTIGGIIYGYIMSAQRAEWSAYSLAAQSAATLRLEQTRAARWDTQATPQVDELVSANFTNLVVDLDLPTASGLRTRATNYTTITTVTTDPPLKFIRVDCVWQFTTGKVFTNTAATFRSPDT